jgi:outer membrane lipoprotein-sorting protein
MFRVLSLVAPLLLLASLASVDAAALMTAPDVMERAEQRFRTLSDYECLIDCEARAGKKVERGTYRVWFRQPSLLRVRVLQGQRRGSEVAMDERGQFRGRKGGLLKPFVVNLQPNDRRLYNVRGKPVTEFSFGSFYRTLRERAGKPGAAMTLAQAGGGETPHTVALSFNDGGRKVRELYRIDPGAWTLTGGEVYEDGALVEQFTVRDLKVNTGVPEKWFRL